MKTKIVYVLSLSDQGCFYEMFLLSVLSLRLHTPKCEVIVVLDKDSLHMISDRTETILDGVTMVGIDIPSEYQGYYGSRYLKTQLRNLVSGDFLYLDTDTIIAEDLSEIDDVQADIAAVTDGNGPKELWNKNVAAVCRKCGIDNPEAKPYFNGGVLFVKDTPAAYAFFERWHAGWQSMIKASNGLDQMALLSASIQLGYPIKELPGIWNCQILSSVAINYFHQAKIIHYFSNGDFVDRVVIPHIKKNGGLGPEAQKLAENPRGYGYNIYRHRKMNPLFLGWSELLFACRTHPGIFIFLKSLSNLAARSFK